MKHIIRVTLLMILALIIPYAAFAAIDKADMPTGNYPDSIHSAKTIEVGKYYFIDVGDLQAKSGIHCRRRAILSGNSRAILSSTPSACCRVAAELK